MPKSEPPGEQSFVTLGYVKVGNFFSVVEATMTRLSPFEEWELSSMKLSSPQPGAIAKDKFKVQAVKLFEGFPRFTQEYPPDVVLKVQEPPQKKREPLPDKDKPKRRRGRPPKKRVT